MMNEVQSFVRNLDNIGKEAIRECAQSIFQAVIQEGARPSYPLNWDSMKQRTAYFATGGFGAGIPYQRTGKYIGSWTMTASSGYARIVNSDPKAVYIGGNAAGKQSRIHAGRWPAVRQVVVDRVARLYRDLAKRIRAMADTLIGVL